MATRNTHALLRIRIRIRIHSTLGGRTIRHPSHASLLLILSARAAFESQSSQILYKHSHSLSSCLCPALRARSSPFLTISRHHSSGALVRRQIRVRLDSQLLLLFVSLQPLHILLLSLVLASRFLPIHCAPESAAQSRPLEHDREGLERWQHHILCRSFVPCSELSFSVRVCFFCRRRLPMASALLLVSAVVCLGVVIVRRRERESSHCVHVVQEDDSAAIFLFTCNGSSTSAWTGEVTETSDQMCYRFSSTSTTAEINFRVTCPWK